MKRIQPGCEIKVENSRQKIPCHRFRDTNRMTYSKKEYNTQQQILPSRCSSNSVKKEVIQSFQPPYHFIVLPRAFHSIFFSSHSIFHRKNVFALVLKLKIAYSNTRTQAHSQAVVLLVVVLQVRRILFSSNTSSKANYGLCAETGKTAAAMTNFSGITKSTEFLTAVIFGKFSAIFFFNRPYFRTF